MYLSTEAHVSDDDIGCDDMKLTSGGGMLRGPRGDRYRDDGVGR